MTTVVHACDKCGAVIAEDRSLYRAEAGPALQLRAEVDLCKSCLEQFAGWLRAGKATAEPQP